MAPRWMVVHKDMTWEQVDFRKDENPVQIFFYKRKHLAEVKIMKENDFTQAYKLKDLVTEETYEMMDFEAFDQFLENNKVIFKNRAGLHKEVRRYLDFSLKK